MLIDRLIEKAFSDGYRYAQKEFGAESKILAVLSPGAYQAKEAAKYGYDKEDPEYYKKRMGYAIKGHFTPGTATYVKKKVEKMAKEGKSKKEIREFLENSGKGSKLALGIGEILANGATAGATGHITNLAATGVGLVDKIDENRAWDKEERRSGKNKKKGRR